MASVISLTFSRAENNDGARLRNEEKGEVDAPRDFTQTIADKRAGLGILILTTSNQLVYQDRRAWELCALIHEGAGHTDNGNNGNSAGKRASRVLPQVVKELCAEITKLLQVWTDAKDWEQYRIERIVRGPDCGIHVSGLGLPGREGGGQSRVLITMEQIGRRHQPVDQAKELFGLTEREGTVVQNLLKGWTNKEIGNELGVTEQTVKEHIKHIMAKTRTTTRTGILVRIMGL